VRHSASCRVAVCSLANALARSAAAADQKVDATRALQKLESVARMDVSKEEATGSSSSASAEVEAAGRQPDTLPHTSHEASEDLGAPSWEDCFHELRDELAVHEQGSLKGSSFSPNSSMVVLGNFTEKASEVPTFGVLRLYRGGQGQDVDLSSGAPPLLEVTVIPAVWNRRLNDAISACLVGGGDAHELGCVDWRAGKMGCIVILLRSRIQRSPSSLDWASAAWFCADAGAVGVVVVNDVRDEEGPVYAPFRMGLFGAEVPPIPAYMVSGDDGAAISDAASQAMGGCLFASVGSATPETISRPGDIVSLHFEACKDAPLPRWPLFLRASQDISRAWSLLETVQRIVPMPSLLAAMNDLAGRMGLPQKRVWLRRRLHRHHRGDIAMEEADELSLAFVECDRSSDQLIQLRRQLIDGTGLGAPDITGEFEVRFRDESAVGSAVVREWMDLVAREAFLRPSNKLLRPCTASAAYVPDAAAPFINRLWEHDFQLLGRLLGLALWQQVTLDLPLHPVVFEFLLLDGATPPLPSAIEDAFGPLSELDEELCRHKVRWLMKHDVATLGFDLPFTDVLVESSEGEEGAGCEGSQASVLPDMLTFADALPADHTPSPEEVERPTHLRHSGPVQVELVPNGSLLSVTEANKQTFVAALLHWRLRGAIAHATQAILKGFSTVVPSSILAEVRSMLSPAELAQLLAGTCKIDVADWEKNYRVIGGLTSSSQEVQWFWQIVRVWAAEGKRSMLQDLLQFATGSRRVPVGGFAHLVGFNGGKHIFTLAKGTNLRATSLPTSHACICTVDLPPWPSLEVAIQKLAAAIEAGHCRFDESAAAEDG